VDELRDLPITKTDILLTHSCHWADTSTIVIERKRYDGRFASKGGGNIIALKFHHNNPTDFTDPPCNPLSDSKG
jgi:hypothetical protein